MNGTVTKELALAAVRNRAHTTNEGRTVVHVLDSFAGADWDLSGVEDLIHRSVGIEYRPHALRHDLVVRSCDGCAYSIDVPHP
ncbi:MAG: hypothetical protein J2P18_11185 [Nocardia sp.]|nr:hypothetical protein [Nocardia sp.]